MKQTLSFELSLLAKSVVFKNLSGAASQVGLSQPQLSRIIQKLEQNTGIPLLDRQSKRHAQWTAQAHELARAYLETEVTFQRRLNKVLPAPVPQEVKFGTLEGLSDEALEYCQKLFLAGVQRVHLDVVDLGDLEARFLQGDYDFILSVHEPGRSKFSFSLQLGHQIPQQVKSSGIPTLSPFEWAQALGKSRGKKAPGQALVTNSLPIRSHWINQYGGNGMLFSPLKKGSGPDKAFKVFLIAGSNVQKSLWIKLTNKTF